MTVDSAVQTLINGLAEQGQKPFGEISVAEGRAVVASFTGLQKPAREVARVVDKIIDGPGGEQHLRIFIPENQGATPLPVVVYYYGGGFVAGSLDVAEESNRALANDTGAIVVAASYLLAPEHKFPAATDDTFAALRWTAEHISEYGGDPARIAVMGDSAGGNLAAVAAQRARDEGGPELAAQALIYPAIDANADTESKREFAEGYVISTADMDYFWGQYLNSPEEVEDPRATPSRGNLAGLPPALVLSVEYEVLRDEAENYADQLSAAGVSVEKVRLPGLIHGVYNMSGAIPRWTEIHETTVDFLRDKLQVN
ncbi:alpha/beta hydrolase [Corynebacterium hylobatis]|uniref:Alpha/beta hydrolase n=1 Tax=Corynebacterium hylobatis TaxID=1859290 RepID=A0A3S0A0Q1_9CORY|nr:alpha/beta hydrolase [Corynebacterium hylobatis]RSZ64672.1 alpha/beta hydrolase [Corynebacterium hylobatis]